jgi:hypothetical protein
MLVVIVVGVRFDFDDPRATTFGRIHIGSMTVDFRWCSDAVTRVVVGLDVPTVAVELASFRQDTVVVGLLFLPTSMCHTGYSE